jgi:hypothetical protein
MEGSGPYRATNRDPAIHQDEASRLLRELQTDIRDQDDLERDIERQVSNQGTMVGSIRLNGMVGRPAAHGAGR